MTDVFDKKTRSNIMSKIKSSDTSIEINFKKALKSKGLRVYKGSYNLIGKPDIVFPKDKIAIFLDGDFWHGYNWKRLGKVPPRKYWQGKILRNIERDKKYNRLLRKDGWKVMRIWEHDVNKNLEKCINKVKNIQLSR